MNRNLRLLFACILTVWVVGMFSNGTPLAQGPKPPGHNLVRMSLDKDVTAGSVRSIKNFLNSATKNDSLELSIDSAGGDMCAGLKLVKAMQTSKADYIKVIVTGEASSAAADIALTSDKIQMRPGTYLMFHYGSIDSYFGLSSHTITKQDMFSRDRTLAEYTNLLDKYMRTQVSWLLAPEDWSVIEKGRMLLVYDNVFKTRNDGDFNGRKLPNEYVDKLLTHCKQYDYF